MDLIESDCRISLLKSCNGIQWYLINKQTFFIIDRRIKKIISFYKQQY